MADGWWLVAGGWWLMGGWHVPAMPAGRSRWHLHVVGINFIMYVLHRVLWVSIQLCVCCTAQELVW
jgi:hypothetical protein